MAELFRIQNYDGVPVFLSDDQWHRHIVEGHPEVAPFLSEMQQVIKAPDLVYLHAGSHIYCKLGAVDLPKFRHLYLDVVVRESGMPPVGAVITAHFRRTPPQGELIWMQKR